MATLTTANSVITLAVLPIFTAPRQIQGYSADDVFSTQPIATTEVVPGIDRRLSAGYVYNPIPWTIVLQADSASNSFFDEWQRYQIATAETYEAQGVIILPSIGQKFTMTRGFMTAWPPMPDAGRVLRPRRYTLTWESMDAEPI